MQFQTPYTKNVKPQTICKDPHLTEQAPAESCDINKILKDYQKTGFIEHAQKHEGMYDDVTSVDFARSMQIVAETKSMFEGLPSSYRAQFNNQPAQFLDFVQNPENAEKMAQMGILKGNDGINIYGAATKAPVEAVQAQSAPTQADKGAAPAAAETASQEA